MSTASGIRHTEKKSHNEDDSPRLKTDSLSQHCHNRSPDLATEDVAILRQHHMEYSVPPASVLSSALAKPQTSREINPE